MKKQKKLCYKCNMFRYLRGFTGKGKRRNSMCNICLKKSTRALIYMSPDRLRLASEPKINQTLSRKNPDNLDYNEVGYWFDEE